MSDAQVRGAPAYRLERAAFPHAYLAEVEAALAESAYVGASPLGAEFVRTEGFSLVFKRTALSDVVETFPFLRKFLEEAIFASSNAFFVNPLIMRGGSEVRPHVDCRLIEEQNVRIIPNLVSIFYVRCDEQMDGGELTLGSGRPDAVSIKPRSNDVLHFRGDIVHHVTPIATEHRRLCLVCEQYKLPDTILAGFPDFNIITDADQFGRRADASPVDAGVAQ